MEERWSVFTNGCPTLGPPPSDWCVMAPEARGLDYYQSTSIEIVRKEHGLEGALYSIYLKGIAHSFKSEVMAFLPVENVVVACYESWGAFGQAGVYSLIQCAHTISGMADAYRELGEEELANCLRRGGEILFPSGQPENPDESHNILFDWEENMGVNPSKLFTYYFENSSDVPKYLCDYIERNWKEAVVSDRIRMQT